MRSDSKYESFIRCGMNPHPNHFIHKYISMFIQEDGLANKEFSGRPAYYIVDNGMVVTSWSQEDLLERYPEEEPRKFTMIPSSLDDNQHMLSKNKNYKSNLKANDPANAAMLLSGNWKYTPAANGIFERSNLRPEQIIMEREMPDDCVYYRAYDKASSVPAREGGDSKTLDPDYSASILFAKSASTGSIYVMGKYIRDSLTNEQLARFRKKPGPRDELIRDQCLLDIENFGDKVYCILPKDPGQAGASEQQQAMKELSKYGIKVKPDPTHGNKSKQVRFEPFCVQTYSDSIYWVKDTFDVAVWDYMLLELENFNPLMKNNGFHDDLVDCFSSAHGMCVANKIIKPFHVPSISADTRLAQFKSSR